jgi:hypothetical protein
LHADDLAVVIVASLVALLWLDGLRFVQGRLFKRAPGAAAPAGSSV